MDRENTILKWRKRNNKGKEFTDSRLHSIKCYRKLSRLKDITMFEHSDLLREMKSIRNASKWVNIIDYTFLHWISLKSLNFKRKHCSVHMHYELYIVPIAQRTEWNVKWNYMTTGLHISTLHRLWWVEDVYYNSQRKQDSKSKEV